MSQLSHLQWTVGDVRIVRVVETALPLPYDPERPLLAEATPEALAAIPWLAPHFVDERGALILSVHTFLLEIDGHKVVVDTCFGNDKPSALLQHQALQTDFLDQIQDAGFPREEIDLVLCTHLHVDHVGWNTMRRPDRTAVADPENQQAPEWVPTFPNAQYLFGRAELEHWQTTEARHQVPVMRDSVTPILDAGLERLVEMDEQLLPSLRLRPTPGHTPGHVSVELESRGESAVITGDVFHHPCQIARPAWCLPFDGDKEQATVTRQEFIEQAVTSGDLVLGTHFPTPTAGRIVRCADGSCRLSADEESSPSRAETP